MPAPPTPPAGPTPGPISAWTRLPAAAALAEAGLGLAGVVGSLDWDAVAPAPFRTGTVLAGARSAVVLASGGRALFDAFRRTPEYHQPGDPLDAYTERVVAEAVETLGAAGVGASAVFAHESRQGQVVDFVALGRLCGLGWPSRLGLLLHPLYGPWLSLRAALLVDRPLVPSHALEGEGPCPACPAPCAAGCPGAALDAGRIDVARCVATRRRDPGCLERCDARRACVVGPAHAYADDAEAHHMRSAAKSLGLLD